MIEVTYGEHTFQIGEPPVGTVIRLANVIGRVGLRAEATVMAALKEPTPNAVVFALLAAMTPGDIEDVAIGAFQFETEREGRKFLAEHGVKFAPLIKAILANFEQSDDLVEAVKAFLAADTALTKIGAILQQPS